MLKIQDTKHITWIDDGQTSLNFYVLIADTTADIPSDPYCFSTDMDKYKIAMGSVVWVIADGDLYAINSSDTWVKQESSGGSGFTPTAEQLAAMNSGITAERLETDETNILSNKNEIDYVGTTVVNERKHGTSALLTDVTALDVLIPLTFEMTGTQYESFTVAVADNNSLTNVEYYENVDPASTLYIKPHYPSTYIRVVDTSGVYINIRYPIDFNKTINGNIKNQSIYVGVGKAIPTAPLTVLVGYGNGENATGQKNTSVGVENLINTTGQRNSSVGYHSLFRCTSGTDNAAIGAESGDDITTGIQNTALGAYSLQRNAVGNNNTAVGYRALRGDTTSGVFDPTAEFNSNTVVGAQSMVNKKSGNNNIVLGFNSCNSTTATNGCIVIGNSLEPTSNNQMLIGTTSITEVILCGNKKINFNNDGTVTWEQIT